MFLKHGEIVLLPLIFMVDPTMNLMSGSIMNVRKENTIFRISRVPKNYSMKYTFHVRGVKGVHIN